MIADIVQTGIASWWAPALAFAAGLISCLSPCVWPLLPGYLSFVTGDRIVGEETGAARKPLAPMLLFILGFTIVFVLLGAFASTVFGQRTVVEILRGTAGQRIGGAIVIAFGVLMIGYALQRGSLSLYADRRPFLAKVRPGSVGAVPLGMAFAAGWTPCIGPVLGAILAIAATGSTARAVLLLVSYSAGLGVPFLLVGLGVTRFMGAFEWVKRRYTEIAMVSGALMIGLGVLLFTGEFTRLVAPLAERFTLGL
ncbi:MAG TPA: cytochrome c biogenesis protein CcdA [Actinomycetota bacterium]|nr:cytochrome c biogenesis protein CcdA [Actinomycetota bacterium]